VQCATGSGGNGSGGQREGGAWGAPGAPQLQMKKVLLERYGAPEECARCADVDGVGAPGAGDVVFDVLLFPINPADVSFCRGTYRLRPPLPATPGAECVGR